MCHETLPQNSCKHVTAFPEDSRGGSQLSTLHVFDAQTYIQAKYHAHTNNKCSKILKTKQQQKELNNSIRVIFYGLSSPRRFVRNIHTSVSVKALQEADMKGKTGYAVILQC